MSWQVFAALCSRSRPNILQHHLFNILLKFTKIESSCWEFGSAASPLAIYTWLRLPVGTGAVTARYITASVFVRPSRVKIYCHFLTLTYSTTTQHDKCTGQQIDNSRRRGMYNCLLLEVNDVVMLPLSRNIISDRLQSCRLTTSVRRGSWLYGFRHSKKTHPDDQPCFSAYRPRLCLRARLAVAYLTTAGIYTQVAN